MHLPLGQTWAERKDGPGAVKRLNLTLLVHAGHQHLVWRV